MNVKYFLFVPVFFICLSFVSTTPTISDLVNLIKLLNGQIKALHNLIKMKDTRLTTDIETLRFNLSEQISHQTALETRVAQLETNPICQQAFDLAVSSSNEIEGLKENLEEEVDLRQELVDDVDELWSAFSALLGENDDTSLTDMKNDIEKVVTDIDEVKTKETSTDERIDSLTAELQEMKDQLAELTEGRSNPDSTRSNPLDILKRNIESAGEKTDQFADNGAILEE